MVPLLSLCLLPLLFAISWADGSFINPDATDGKQHWDLNQVWHLGEVQTLEWQTTLTSFNITLWQQNLLKGQAVESSSEIFTYSGSDSSNGPNQYAWVVQLYGFDLNASPVFFLALDWHDSNSPGFTSQYFNITDKAANSSASSTSSASPAPTSTLPSPSSNVSSPSNSSVSPTNQTEKSSSSDDTAVKVGLGVGLGLGIALLLIVAGFLGLRYFHSRREQTPAPEAPTNTTFYEAPKQEYVAPSVEAPAPPWQPPHHPPYEMDASMRR